MFVQLKKIFILFISVGVVFLGTPNTWAQEAISAKDLADLNQKLMTTINVLNSKIDALEKRVSATEKGTNVSIPAASGTNKPGVMRTLGGDIQFSGFVDTGANYNFNHQDTSGTDPQGNKINKNGNALRSLDGNSDTFDLHNTELIMERPLPEDKGGVGFKTVFMYGSDAQSSDSNGFNTTDEFAIQQAYIQGKIPVGSGLKIWAGKFATLQGAEVIENYLNWNSSRSFLFGLAIPFTHTGVRAIYDWFGGKLNTTVGLVNGWDSAIDNNGFKDVESRVTWNASQNLSLSSGFLTGSQVANDSDRRRGVIDSVITWTPLANDLPGLKLMGNYDFGWEERLAPQGGPDRWNGYALYAKYDINSWWSVGTRWEQFDNERGSRISTDALGTHMGLWEMTYTSDFKVYQNLLTRLEYRHDRGDHQLFRDGTSDFQDTVGVNLIYNFG